MTKVALADVAVYSPSQEVKEAPHQDTGWIALQRADGQYLSWDQHGKQFKWSDSAGSWERWRKEGQAYVHIDDAGRVIVLPKGEDQ